VSINGIAQVYSYLEGNAFHPLWVTAFIYYVDDVSDLLNDFSIAQEVDAYSFVWVSYDEMTRRSLINMTCSLSV
jgi:hypothetical protein